jgi:hypothetical protein
MSNIRSKTRRQTDTRKRNRKGGKSQKKRIGRKNKTVLKRGGEDICPICHEILDEKATGPTLKVYTTNCKHQFHTGCLYKSCLENELCPICRQNIDSNCEEIKQNSFYIKKEQERIREEQKRMREEQERMREEQERMRPLSDSEIDEVLEKSGFMKLEEYGDDKDAIKEWKTKVSKLRYDDWVNCFTGEIDENLKEQAIAKIQYWIETQNWGNWEWVSCNDE